MASFPGWGRRPCGCSSGSDMRSRSRRRRPAAGRCTRTPATCARRWRRYVEVFEDCAVIVVPSGSCTGSVRHQHAMVARRFGDEKLASRAEAVAARTFELSELLIDVLGVEDVGAYYPHRVTYHPTCHSLRLLRVGDRPVRLLRNVAGLDLVELPDAEVCCGFGGTFAVKNADVSTAMLADKMRGVLATRAEVCTAGDSSCLMHIGGRLSRLNAGTRTVHLAEILASARAGRCLTL